MSWVEDEGYDYYGDEDDGVCCNRCGEPYLHWEKTERGWRLFNNDGEQHFCNVTPDDFDDLT